MVWIVAFVIIGLLCLGLWLLAPKLAEPGSANTDSERKWIRRVAIGIFGFWFLLHTGLASTHQIGAGHVGVIRTFGEITGQLSEGLKLTAPWQSVDDESLQVRSETFDLFSPTAESADVRIVVTVNYRVNSRDVQQLHREVGIDWERIVLFPRVPDIFKNVTQPFRLEDILENRPTIGREATETLTEEMDKFSVQVVDVLIENIDLPAPFLAEVERKLAAEQEAQTAEFNRARRIVDAEAEEQEIIIRSRGLAEANRLLDGSLTPTLLQWQALEKIGDNVQIALIPSGQGIIIDPATLFGTLRSGQEETSAPTRQEIPR